MKIIKRDGKIVNYNRDKIIIAISKANKEVSESNRVNADQIEEIVSYIENLDKKRMLVEDIQDIIENKLMEYGKYELAKKYIVYRYTRALVRRKNAMDESILGLIKKKDDTGLESNPNKNSVLASTQRDLIAGEVSKELTKKILLPTKIVKAHEDGEIFFNDSDYFLQSIFDCSYLDLEDMLSNETVINNTLIETPKTFLVASLVTTQIITSIACNQYGGVSIDVSVLAKYLNKTRCRLEKELDFTDLSNEEKKIIIEQRYKYELSSGVQLIQYQLNTLMTTNGQCPSVTLFLNCNGNKEYQNENIDLIKEILRQRLQGIKNIEKEVAYPRFPKLVYLLDETNCLEGGEYDYLTRLALECSKKGGYPDYISSKMMKKNYKNKVFAPIGEHQFLLPYYTDDGYKYLGRFNQGTVTINLVQIALLSIDNENNFFKLLDERLELAKEALMCKYYSLLSVNTDISPLHYIYGGISRLNPGEGIDSLLNEGYSNLSLSFVGLNETVSLLRGEDENLRQELALKILKRMRAALDKYKQSSGIAFCLYAGDDPNISYYFASKDKLQYGNIKGITDKGYYNANFHNDSKNLGQMEKLEIEKNYDLYCNGGASHLVDIDRVDNDIQFEDIIKYAYNNLIYLEFRRGDSECKVCGYKGRVIKGIKHSYECPNCHNKDKTKFVIKKSLYE